MNTSFPTKTKHTDNRTTVVLDKPPMESLDEKVKKAPLFKVMLWNDHITPYYKVVEYLRVVFDIDENGAFTIMQNANDTGSAVIVVLREELAKTKAQEMVDLGQNDGYPLNCTAEEEE